MTVNQKIQWGRLSAEIIAIVVSILVAFAIDAWWQNRIDRRVEVQYLLAVREDIVASVDSLNEVEASQQLQIGYLEALLAAGSDTPDSEDIRSWIEEGLFNVGGYEPQLSSLRDLESSGQTLIIQDPEIRQSLASLSQKLESLRSVQADFIQSQQLLIDPFLVDRFDLTSILRVGETDFEPDMSVLVTREFRSRVAFKLSLRKIVGSVQGEVRAGFDEALTRIESQLETLQ